jgi:ribosomal protein S18 acetylase RimI-like enzyme
VDISPLPPPLLWREATADDEALLEALFIAGREDLKQLPGDAAFIQQLARMQRQVHEAGLRQNYPRALRLVVERDGQPVGHAIVNIGETELRLVDVAVLPAARRGGVARAAVACLQREAAGRGLPVGLMVNRANAAACALYTGLGFVAGAQDTLFVQMHWRAGTQAVT